MIYLALYLLCAVSFIAGMLLQGSSLWVKPTPMPWLVLLVAPAVVFVVLTVELFDRIVLVRSHLRRSRRG